MDMLDFCLGGLFLHLDAADAAGAQVAAPQPNDPIEVLCEIPGALIRTIVRFKGRVARVNGRHVGMTFIAPPAASLKQMLDHIGASSRRSSEPQPRVDGVPWHLKACRDIAETRLDAMIKDLASTVSDLAFKRASESRDRAEQNTLFAVLNFVEQSESRLTSEFHARVATRLGQHPSTIDFSRREDAAEVSLASLRLVENEELDHWLLLSELATKTEQDQSDALYGLEQRLSALYGLGISHGNNPFGPATFAQAFMDSLNAMSCSPASQSILCKYFRDLMCKHLGTLYEALNAYLIEQGIVPKLVFSVKKPVPEPPHVSVSTVPASSAERQERPASSDLFHLIQRLQDVEQRLMADSGRSDVGSGNAPAAGRSPHHRTSNAYPIEHGVMPALADQVDKTVTGAAWASETPGPAAGQHHGPASSEMSRLIHRLQDLEQRVIADSGHGDTGSGGAPVADKSSYSVDELLNALSRLETAMLRPGADDRASKVIETRLLDQLHQLSADADNKQLGARESRIVRAAGDISGFIVNDQIVARNVVPWLQRLVVPLLKMAILDESVFTDRDHTARQFINKISQLELYGDEQGHASHNAVCELVNGLLDQLDTQQSVTGESFSAVLKTIDRVIELQNRAYNDNLNELVLECERQAPELEDACGAAEAQAETIPDLSADLDEWRKRARRLRVGDWMQFAAGTENARRLRLAWVSPRHMQFVFANQQGRKDCMLDIDQLAGQMARATAVRLENADELLVDRAQYQMLHEMQQRLLHESAYDHLTAMINRREFMGKLEHTLARVRSENTTATLCYLNLGQMQAVNTTYGYDAGDHLIQAFAKLLRQHLGTETVLGRLGGDVFGAILEHEDTDGAQERLRGLRSLLADQRIVWNGHRIALSFCAGVAPINTELEDVNHLVQDADAGCQLAKNRGANSDHVVASDDQSISKKRQIMRWALRIDDTLDEKFLDLHAQSIVPLTDAPEVDGHAEILLRLRDQYGNRISPENFILAAEHYRRMPLVDRWVVSNVFRWISDHHEVVDQIGGFAINLSGLSVNDETFADFLLSEIERFDIPTRRLCFEITETAGINSLSNAAEFINVLKKTGCSFSIDDFGSGMSSYAYLKHLPVDYLKIDGQFVKTMDRNPADFALVRSIADIAHYLGKKVIAECVETEAILTMLRDIGVDFVQGFAIQKPVPLADLAPPKPF